MNGDDPQPFKRCSATLKDFLRAVRLGNRITIADHF